MLDMIEGFITVMGIVLCALMIFHPELFFLLLLIAAFGGMGKK